MAGQIHEDAFGSVQKGGSRATHGAAEEADGVRNVGPGCRVDEGGQLDVSGRHVGLEGDGDAIRQVRDVPLVLHVPPGGEGLGKSGVQGVSGVVAGVEHEEVVDDEDARVSGGLSEALGEKPREECALPAAAGLGHAVDGFFDAADTGAAVAPEGSVALWWVTVDDLPSFE
eukprot:9503950-Pyramimonas_sp.AAC.2